MSFVCTVSCVLAVLAEITSLTEWVLPPLEIPRGGIFEYVCSYSVTLCWHRHIIFRVKNEVNCRKTAITTKIKIPRRLINTLSVTTLTKPSHFSREKSSEIAQKLTSRRLLRFSIPSRRTIDLIFWCQVCISVKPFKMSTSCSSLFWRLLFTQIQNTTLHIQRFILFK